MNARPAVLVTGATGFLGRDLVPRLIRRGYRVRAACRHPELLAQSQDLEPVVLPDLASAGDLVPLVEGVAGVVHLAGIAHATRAIPEARYMAVNAAATEALAAASRRSGVGTFVLMSSIRAQSGPTAAKPLTEADVPEPTDAYGRSKLAAERVLEDTLAGSMVRGVALRPVLVHGPGVKGNLGALLRLARLPLPLPLAGLGNRRSLVSIANLGAAVVHVLESAAVRGTYLVADPEPMSVAEIIAAMRRGLGREPGLFHVPLAPFATSLTAIGKGDLWQRLAGELVADAARLSATGWTPVETTAAGLAAMARDGSMGPNAHH